MKNKNEIHDRLVEILTEEFELQKVDVTLDADLYQDLGLDSIDAVDLIVKLQEVIGDKIDPETFKKVRTVEDVVDAIDKMLNE